MLATRCAVTAGRSWNVATERDVSSRVVELSHSVPRSLMLSAPDHTSIDNRETISLSSIRVKARLMPELQACSGRPLSDGNEHTQKCFSWLDPFLPASVGSSLQIIRRSSNRLEEQDDAEPLSRGLVKKVGQDRRDE